MRRATAAFVVIAALVGSWLTAPSASAAPPTATLGLSKQAFRTGTSDPLTDPVLPGGTFDYQLSASCSGLTEGCITARTVDVLPPEVQYVGADTSPLYTVAFDPATRTVTVVYTDKLAAPPNPTGSQGIPAGSTRTATLHVRLDPNASVQDGDTVTNTATASADNAAPATDSAVITVSVPRAVTPVATKTLAPDSVVAQSGGSTTATLSVRNASTGGAQVTSLSVADLTPATWDAFDLVSVGPVAEFPPGADQVSVQTCTAAAPCGDADFVAGPFVTGPDLALPPGVDPAAVTGVRFTFRNSAGTLLPAGPTAGVVPLQLHLRNTVRSTGRPLDPGSALTQRNCATPAAVDQVTGAVAGNDACAPFTIQPGNAVAEPSKQFFPDAAGSFTRNGYAVAGQASPVTALQQVRNGSAFPVTSMTLTDPSTTTPSDFALVAASELRLSFPSGATAATGLVTCSDGSSAPIAATATTTLPAGCPAGSTPTAVTVTYTGSIPPGATGALGVHGTLTDAAAAGSTVSDCFDGALTAGQTSAIGTACAQLPVEAPRTTVGGVKSSSSPATGGALVPGFPVTFRLQATNSGNLPQSTFVITDPAPGTTPNPFDVVRLTGAPTVSTSPRALASQFLAEVTTNGTTWTPAAGVDLMNVVGVRARRAFGLVPPTATVTLQFPVVLRDGVQDGTDLRNCQTTTVASVAGTGSSGDVCAPTLTSEPPSTAGQVTKLIAPAALPAPVPGLVPTAQVQLRAQNTGNVPMRRIVVVDPDPTQDDPDGFFERADVSGALAVNFPPGADRVQVDACLSAVDCLAGTYVTGTPSATPAFPPGVTLAAIAGVRFTFTGSGGGFVLNPGANFPNSGPCVNATVCFSVTPRTTLRTTGAAITFPESFSDVATAGGESQLTNGALVSFGPAPAPLTVAPGTPQLRAAKTADGAPATTVAPGAPVTYALITSNSGTTAIPALSVVEPLPAGLLFDNTLNGDGGLPFRITSTVPAGTPALPAPTFTPVVDTATNRITALRWDWPADVSFYPTSTVAITFQARLDPTVAAGTAVTNTYGATTTDPVTLAALTCATGTPDPTLGCTAGASATAGTGSAVDAQKWVHGTDSRGFYNTRTGEFVAIGDPSCPLLVSGGDSYTRFPCIALVYAGEDFRYLVNLTNVGTTPLTETRLIDYLPKPGDTGVVVTGERGTQWDPRPRLTGPPTVAPNAPGALALAYSATSPTCTGDIAKPEVACPAGTWDPTFSADAAAFRAVVSFATPLPPAGSTQIVLPMSSPPDLGGSEALPIAWNSFAHTDFFRQPNGSSLQLPPVEPEKVGVALPFGELEIAKVITGTVPPGSVIGPFRGTYTCIVTTAGGESVPVRTGEVEFSTDVPVVVTHVPAGAVCSVTELDAGGGTATDPAPVTIQPDLTPDASSPTRTVVTNDFPAHALIVEKRFAGPAGSFGAGLGPFPIDVTCTVAGSAAPLPGFPVRLTFPADGVQTLVDQVDGVRLPVGARCTVSEADTRGATSTETSYSDGDAAVVTAQQDGLATVTNTYDAARLTVTKQVAGPGPAGPYHFTAACTLRGSGGSGGDPIPVALAEADASFALSAGQQRVITVPSGAACTVTETGLPTGDTATYDGAGTATPVPVEGDVTLAVVNTFMPVTPPTTAPPPPTSTPAPPAPLPLPGGSDLAGTPAPAPAPVAADTSSGSGLADTGAPVRAGVLGAGLLIAAGLTLVLASRRRRARH